MINGYLSWNVFSNFICAVETGSIKQFSSSRFHQPRDGFLLPSLSCLIFRDCLQTNFLSFHCSCFCIRRYSLFVHVSGRTFHLFHTNSCRFYNTLKGLKNVKFEKGSCAKHLLFCPVRNKSISSRHLHPISPSLCLFSSSSSSFLFVLFVLVSRVLLLSCWNASSHVSLRLFTILSSDVVCSHWSQRSRCVRVTIWVLCYCG